MKYLTLIPIIYIVLVVAAIAVSDADSVELKSHPYNNDKNITKYVDGDVYP